MLLTLLSPFHCHLTTSAIEGRLIVPCPASAGACLPAASLLLHQHPRSLPPPCCLPASPPTPPQPAASLPTCFSAGTPAAFFVAEQDSCRARSLVEAASPAVERDSCRAIPTNRKRARSIGPLWQSLNNSRISLPPSGLSQPLVSIRDIAPMSAGGGGKIALALDFLQSGLELLHSIGSGLQPGFGDGGIVDFVAQRAILKVEVVVAGHLIGFHGVGTRAKRDDVAMNFGNGGTAVVELMFGGVEDAHDQRVVTWQRGQAELEREGLLDCADIGESGADSSLRAHIAASGQGIAAVPQIGIFGEVAFKRRPVHHP